MNKLIMTTTMVGNNNNIVTNVLKYFIITIICWKEQLTIPPSRASWSSATIRTMLLSLPRASAHLMQQVSNVKSSATPARFSPFRLRPHHPGEIVGPSIGACEEQGLTRSHAHRHKLARGPTKTQFQFPFWGRSSARVSVQWTEQRSRDKHAVVRFEEVQLVIWSEEWAGSRLRTSCSWRDHFARLYFKTWFYFLTCISYIVLILIRDYCCNGELKFRNCIIMCSWYFIQYI